MSERIKESLGDRLKRRIKKAEKDRRKPTAGTLFNIQAELCSAFVWLAYEETETLALEERLRHISAYALELADKLKGERMTKEKRDWTYSGPRRTWPKGSK